MQEIDVHFFLPKIFVLCLNIAQGMKYHRTMTYGCHGFCDKRKGIKE